ncbi:MAG TPA: hypothetical protein VFY96_07490 [Candidatus Binatia bacterium]|nr:hypothetical protein [Candidatus Binatia bacterium]
MIDIRLNEKAGFVAGLLSLNQLPNGNLLMSLKPHALQAAPNFTYCSVFSAAFCGK